MAGALLGSIPGRVRLLVLRRVPRRRPDWVRERVTVNARDRAMMRRCTGQRESDGTGRHTKLEQRFDEVQAVKDMNLEISDEEFVVLDGPSGCGKTTTLRMMAGLESITSGEILIGDQVVNELPPKDRDIAIVFQNYALYPHMNVYDNMAFGLKMHRFDRAEIDARVHAAAEILGI